jgi:hypothetical protein
MARYKLIGAEIQGQDTNKRTPTLAEQVTDPRAAVVYETDDSREAQAILDAGGFFRDRDDFIAVSRIVDSDNLAPAPSAFPQKGN